ncbi:MAG: peptidyl-prolyl cis-trans isomerase [Candidatus Omnitrophota bacterium]|nr:peptidyl-prolyl cis-trans isomerase [Candidatus Omnitrophota bacterium]
MKYAHALIFSLTLLSFAAVGTAAELLDRVIAVVNDEPITQSELDVLFRPIYDDYKNEIRGEELMVKLNDIRRKLLNQLIEDRLVFQEAEDRKLEVDPSAIDKQVQEFKKRFLEADAVESALASQGLTMRDVRDRFRRQEMVRQLHDMEIRSKVVVSPAEVEEFYYANQSEFSDEERIKVRSITIKKDEEAREKGLKDEEARSLIEDLRSRILLGEDFGALAREFSQDIHAADSGMSEWLTRGSMIAVIDDAIFKMKQGEISDFIETPMGYHMFRLEEKHEGHQRDLEEVRDEIFAHLFRQKAQERFQEWMLELKRGAYISIR